MRHAALTLLAIFLATTASAVDCDAYVAEGKCGVAKYQSYMEKHCPGSCGGGGGAAAAAEAAGGADEDDEQCEAWAADGYCSHEQYKAYMERSCRQSCGFGPADTGAAADAAAADAELEEEVTEEEEEAAAQTAEYAASASEEAEGGGGGGSGAASAAEESEHCAGWAKQGLCEEGSSHYDYMKGSCAHTCSAYMSGGSVGADHEYDPIRCAQWAMRGFCEDGHSHQSFMNQNCQKECEAARNYDPNGGEPPPFDFFVLIILGGFGYLAYYLVKMTIVKDAEKSSTVASKTLGMTVKSQTVGPGKPNRSAMQMHKRSAKKT